MQIYQVYLWPLKTTVDFLLLDLFLLDGALDGADGAGLDQLLGHLFGILRPTKVAYSDWKLFYAERVSNC